MPLWVFRTVGAFPYREEPAPAHVYPLVLIVVVRLVVFGFLHSRGSARLSIVGVCKWQWFPAGRDHAGDGRRPRLVRQGRYLMP